jgi:hypothetical protein
MYFTSVFASHNSSSCMPLSAQRPISEAARSAFRCILLFGGLFADHQGAQPNIQPMSPQSILPARMCFQLPEPAGSPHNWITVW